MKIRMDTRLSQVEGSKKVEYGVFEAPVHGERE
jgi:hypothetical protein